MQNPDNQTARCGTCGAPPGRPCKTRGGKEAGKVHWGRPRRSSRAERTYQPVATPRVPFGERYAEEIREAESARYKD